MNYQWKEKRSKDNYLKISIQQLELNNEFMRVTEMLLSSTLGEKGPYSELFWSAFSRIWTEYGEESLRIQSKCRKMRNGITPNTDTFYAVVYTTLVTFNENALISFALKCSILNQKTIFWFKNKNFRIKKTSIRLNNKSIPTFWWSWLAEIVQMNFLTYTSVSLPFI